MNLGFAGKVAVVTGAGSGIGAAVCRQLAAEGAEVIAADKVKKADKLLKIQLDLGTEKRQVISGIAEHYAPEDLVGKKVICVVNLKPVKLRGEMSEGMILSGESADGKLALATVEQDLPNGSIVK